MTKKKMLGMLVLRLLERKFRAGLANPSFPEMQQNEKMDSIEKCAIIHPLIVKKFIITFHFVALD